MRRSKIIEQDTGTHTPKWHRDTHSAEVKESVRGIIEEISMESKADSVEPSSKRDFMDIFEWRPYRPVANAWMAI
jgi:hypothetical protein